MSSMSDKANVIANEAAGKVKQGVGKVLDKPDLEVEGALQQKKGEAQNAIGKAKDKVKSLVDKA